MMFIELPEGTYLSVDAIVGIAPRAVSEYDDTVNGSIVLLISGAEIETDETQERILAQIAEALAAAQELEDDE